MERTPDDTDDYGRRLLPDAISTIDDVATVARAIGDYFGENDDNLARMANAIASVAEARKDYDSDHSRYGARITFVDTEGDPHTAIVLEPEVAVLDAPEAWDPHRGEMVDPREAYPLGTVQCIYPSDGKQWTDGFFFDRLSGLETATSVQPATGPDDAYCYYPGWEYADADRDDGEGS